MLRKSSRSSSKVSSAIQNVSFGPRAAVTERVPPRLDGHKQSHHTGLVSECERERLRQSLGRTQLLVLDVGGRVREVLLVEGWR
jgi:hypothetical protein